MPDQHNPRGFASRLLQQDESLSDSKYQEYRMKLENALRVAERREKLAGRVVVASCVITVTLMFVGGSRLLGDFDPWSKEANFVSVAAGVVYLLATGVFFLSLASYFSRFRPGVKAAREEIRDAMLLDLQRQVRELREQGERRSSRAEPNCDQPKAD
jgi:hypothetical protein